MMDAWTVCCWPFVKVSVRARESPGIRLCLRPISMRWLPRGCRVAEPFAGMGRRLIFFMRMMLPSWVIAWSSVMSAAGVDTEVRAVRGPVL